MLCDSRTVHGGTVGPGAMPSDNTPPAEAASDACDETPNADSTAANASTDAIVDVETDEFVELARMSVTVAMVRTAWVFFVVVCFFNAFSAEAHAQEIRATVRRCRL